MFRRLSFAALFILSIMLLIGSIAPSYAQDVRLQAMRVGEHPDKTRLVLELSQLSDFRSFALSNPYRVVVDIPSLQWQDSAIIPAAGPIKTLRMAQYTADMARLVLEFEQPALVKSAFMMPATAQKPPRLVVDMGTSSAAEFERLKSRIHGTLPPPEGAARTGASSGLKAEGGLPFATRKPALRAVNLSGQPAAINTGHIPVPAAPPQRKFPSEKPLIMLDAGHGGVDSGAVNGSIYEKEITLSMTKTLRRMLERTGRYRVQLTRSDDTYLKLYQRVALARRADADLFISIHADSIRKSHVRGASVYTLSNKASDKQTARLAARENQSDTIAGIDLSVEDQDVANILIDLSMRETMNQSKYFANSVVDGMKAQRITMLRNPHRYAGFAVLKAPDIPSVLIEVGFVSHHQEARRLLQKDHQEKLARGIIKGIDRYFETLTRNASTQ